MSTERAEGPRPEGARADGQAREPSEDELRAAYEAELSRITSTDVMLQAAVSLLNLGGRRLGPIGGETAGAGGEAAGERRDLEQVRDAIDGVRALLGVLERRFSNELGPLRDALSQLQIAYAREAIERLAMWTSPIRAELGIEPSFADRNGAQRQRQLIEAGAPREEVFAAATEETRQTYAQEVRV